VSKGWTALLACRAALIDLADGMDHDNADCPGDDTCSCENIAKVQSALEQADAVIKENK